MTAKARVKGWVADLIAGANLQTMRTAWKGLSTSGRQGVDAILDALEGKSGPAPAGRDFRDLHADLFEGLYGIAQVAPWPLIAALDRRPGHTLNLLEALSCSRDEAAVRKLLEYAKRKDPWIRYEAVSGLATFAASSRVSRSRRKAVLQPLLDALRDRSDRVRDMALAGLAKIADRTAIEPLKRYLANKRLRRYPGLQQTASELLKKLEKARK
jgi:hypothetical protein